MKVRGKIAGPPLGARLTALCWGALTLLAPAAVSACSSSTSTPTVINPTLTGTATGRATGTATGTAPASPTHTPTSGSSPETGSPETGTSHETGTPGVNSSPASPVVTVTHTVTVPPSSAPPAAAPVTGGGGTAGFQGTLLLAIGVAAILAGTGGLAYRRWLGRGRLRPAARAGRLRRSR